MARVTVEDCISKVENNNRFELVALAAQRARSINSGVAITVERNNDKDAVIALREIAMGHVTPKALRVELIKGLQKRSKIDGIEDESLHILEEMTDEFQYITNDPNVLLDEEDLDLDDEYIEPGDIIDEGYKQGG